MYPCVKYTIKINMKYRPGYTYLKSFKLFKKVSNDIKKYGLRKFKLEIFYFLNQKNGS